MDANREKMLAKIKALLAKAEDPAATPEEAETYRGKAMDLVAKYGIEHALLVDDGGQGAGEVADRVVEIDEPFGTDQIHILNDIARSLGVRVIRTDHNREYQTVSMVGYTSDLDRVEMLFDSILVQLAHELGKQTCPSHITKREFGRNFMGGFSAKVRERLRQAEEWARREAEQGRRTGRSVELVLADRRDQVERRFNQKYPHRGSMRARGAGAGTYEGALAGSRADLGGARFGGTGSRAIGG